MNHTFYIQKIMKNGAKNDFIKKTIVATIDFVLFTLFIFITGTTLQKCSTGSIIMVISFLLSLLITIAFLIMFLSAWEEIFKSEGEQ